MRSFSLLTLVLVVGVSLVYGNPTEIVLLANSIDYELAQDFITFLENKGFAVVRVEAASFDTYKSSGLIIILGGPDAPEGVGEVAQIVLTAEEGNNLRVSGNKNMHVKSNVWGDAQKVFLLAGSDRIKTMEAHIQYRDSLYEQVALAVQPSPPLTPPSPLPTGSKTIFAGEYVESISYWGYIKNDGYTTVRLQGRYRQLEVGRSKTGNTSILTYKPYPLAQITFKDSELPFKFRLDNIEYEILYYDNEMIIVKKL